LCYIFLPTILATLIYNIHIQFLSATMLICPSHISMTLLDRELS